MKKTVENVFRYWKKQLPALPQCVVYTPLALYVYIRNEINNNNIGAVIFRSLHVG